MRRATGPRPTPAEVAKLFVVFAKTLQYAYLFGIVPALMMAAVDDILFHVKRIDWVVRMLIVGVIAFAAAELLYGRAGRTPAPFSSFFTAWSAWSRRLLSSWLAHKYAEPLPAPAAMSRDRMTQLASGLRVTM